MKLVKIYVLPAEIRSEILSLFGTTANAARRLRLSFGYQIVNHGLRGTAIQEAQGEEIERAWHRWKLHYIRGVALGLDLELNNFEQVPEQQTDDLADKEIKEWMRRLRPQTESLS